VKSDYIRAAYRQLQMAGRAWAADHRSDTTKIKPQRAT
jgi:hypothetical protein